MKTYVIPRRYAKAICQLLEKKDYEKILTDIKIYQEFFETNKSLLKNLNSIIFHYNDKKKIIEKLTNLEQINLSSLWENIFNVLIKKKRMLFFMGILEELEKLILKFDNKEKYLLILAHSPSKSLLEDIKEKVSKKINKDVIFDLKINPEIIGGFVVEGNSLKLDASVKTNLEKYADNVVHVN